ncbi:MAG TPA: DUF3592 domain-containing protein [Bryobacteraceae bacterium]|nr:DUF3592 domain-containing protein [Bryobacteraceae bacterium]
MDHAAPLFPENWAPPRELAGPPPRKTRLTGFGRFANVLALALLPLAIFTGFAFHMARRQTNETNEKLRLDGRGATARIVRLWHTSGRNSTDVVTYVFSAGNARVESDCAVPVRAWDHLRIGGDLPVRYLPARPSVNLPVGWEEDPVPLWLALGVPGLCAAISFYLFFMIRSRGEIASRGVPAPGVITRCIEVKTGWSVQYRFRAADGTVLGGSDQTNRPCRESDAVCVLYLPGNPRRNSLYPCAWHRI